MGCCASTTAGTSNTADPPKRSTDAKKTSAANISDSGVAAEKIQQRTTTQFVTGEENPFSSASELPHSPALNGDGDGLLNGMKHNSSELQAVAGDTDTQLQQQSSSSFSPPRTSRRRSTHRHFSSTVLGAWAFDVAVARSSMSGSFKHAASGSGGASDGVESPERLSGVPSSEFIQQQQRTSLTSTSSNTAAPPSETVTSHRLSGSQCSPYGAASHRLSIGSATTSGGVFSAGSLTLHPSGRSDTTRSPRSPMLPRNPLEKPTPRDRDVMWSADVDLSVSSSLRKTEESEQPTPPISAEQGDSKPDLPKAPDIRNHHPVAGEELSVAGPAQSSPPRPANTSIGPNADVSTPQQRREDRRRRREQDPFYGFGTVIATSSDDEN